MVRSDGVWQELRSPKVNSAKTPEDKGLNVDRNLRGMTADFS